jgi:cystathionine beta-lyase/cystathionine gamma-synthase
MTNQTRIDLAQDFLEYRTFVLTAIDRLRSFEAILSATITAESNISIVKTTIASLLDQYTSIQTSINGADCENNSIDSLIAIKNQSFQQLRTLQGLTAAALVSTDWQSPSFNHSLQSNAGSQTGKIIENATDYKRDNHLDAQAYESAFRDAYIDAPWHNPQTAHVTSSCMSALIVTAGSILATQKHDRPVLIGKHSYFQNKQVVESLFGNRVHYANELDTNTFLHDIDRLQPCAIFVDSLCNVSEVGIPDLETLIPMIAKRIRHRTTLVIDNSGLATSFQPLQYLPKISKLSVIVVEGLNKYHQYGFDRVTGGILWTNKFSQLPLAGNIQDYGAIIGDTSALSLPVPNRSLFDAHIVRISRNTLELAAAVQSEIVHRSFSPISHAAYPGLPNHPAYDRCKNRPFNGGFFTINFKKPFNTPRFYDRFVHHVIEIARTKNVPMICGTGFGFTTTRIYVTARFASQHVTPFIRISAGNETWDEMERVKTVLQEACRTFVI